MVDHTLLETTPSISVLARTGRESKLSFVEEIYSISRSIQEEQEGKEASLMLLKCCSLLLSAIFLSFPAPLIRVLKNFALFFESKR